MKSTAPPKLRLYYRSIIYSTGLMLLVSIFGCAESSSSLASTRLAESSVSDSLYRQYLEKIDLSFEVDAQTADSLLDVCLAYFTKTEDVAGIAEVYLSIAYYKERNNHYLEALTLIDSVMPLVSQLDDTIQLLNLYNTAGNANAALGNNITAIELYREMLELAQSSNDTIGMIRALGNSSLVYGDLDDHEKSKNTLHEVLKLSTAINSYENIIHCKLNLAVHYLKEDINVDSAYFYNVATNALINEHCIEELKPMVATNFAAIELLRGRLYAAEQLLVQLLTEKGSTMTLREIAIAKITLGEVYFEAANYAKSFDSFFAADTIIDEMQDAFLKIELEKRFFKIYEATGNYQLAYQCYQSYTNKEEELSGAEAQQQLVALQNAAASKEKDRKIVELKQLQLIQEASLQRKRSALWFIVIIAILSMLVFQTNHIQHQKAQLLSRELLIAENNLALLRSQINPDFVLKSFEGVQDYLQKSDRMRAYVYLGSFASLLRMVINSTKETFNDLEQEVKITAKFLELETMRFQGLLTHEITIAPELKEQVVKIPGMMIQPHLESCIASGLASEDESLHLTIDFTAFGDEVKVRIRDNSAKINAACSNAINKRVHFLHQLGYVNTRVEIRKLSESDGHLGNEITIYLPTS